MAGKRIVLTGATRGLGRALTSGFVDLGHTVFGCGRSTALVAELASGYGAPHQFTDLDVTDEERVAAWARQILSEGGPPDLLINNAAIMNRPAPLWEIGADEFDVLIDVNIKGVANVIRQFVPAMVARGSGVIVNLSSGWGRSTSAEVAPYCASKWAVEGLTRALAQELPRGMAAVPLNPGIIDTEMLRTAWDEGAARFPKAEEWATAAVPFLLQMSGKDNGKPLTVPGQ